MTSRFQIVRLLSALLFAVLFIHAAKYNNGPPAGRTNAPGETNCTACHSGTLNPTTFKPTIQVGTGQTEYAPGQTYAVTVTAAEPNFAKFGFELTILQPNGAKAGTLINGGGGTQLINGTVQGNQRQYIEHTSAGTAATSTGQRVWSFSWTAPAANVGNITFYLAVVHANGNNNDNGDKVYTQTLVLTPQTTTLPTIATSVNVGTDFCVGQTIPVSFSVSSAFDAGNVFTAELSDASGSFASPTTIGSLNGTTSGQINATFPTGTPFGGGYRIRVVGSSPSVIGLENTQNLTINPLPNVTASASVTNICPGDPVVLTASGAAEYIWQPGGLFGASVTVTPNHTTTYVVSGSSASGCIKTASVQVVVNNTVVPPKITLSDTVVCPDEQITVTGNSFSNVTYVWDFDGGNVVSGTGKGPYTVSWPASGLHTVSMFVIINGCSTVVDHKTVNVKGAPLAPTVNCGASTQNSVSFNWSDAPDSVTYEISVDGGAFVAPNTGATGHSVTGLTPNQSVTAVVRATNECGFVSPVSSPVSCTAQNCSAISFGTSSKNLLLCPGRADTLRVNGTNIGSPLVQWNGTNGAVLPGDPKKFAYVVPDTAFSVSVTVSDANQPTCPGVTAVFKITPALGCPKAKFKPSTDTCCVGSEIKVNFTGIFNGATGFGWQFGGADVVSGADKGPFSVRWDVPGEKIIALTVTDNGSPVSTFLDTIVVLPPILLNLTKHNASDAGVADGSIAASVVGGAAPFQFILDQNLQISETPDFIFENLTAGTYAVTAKDRNGCLATDTVRLGTATALTETDAVAFNIFPNPTDGAFEIRLHSAKTAQAGLEFVDALGRVVLTRNLSLKNGENSEAVGLNGLSSGVYTLSLSVDGRILYRKVVLK